MLLRTFHSQILNSSPEMLIFFPVNGALRSPFEDIWDAVLLTVSSLDVVTVPTSRLHLQQLHGPVQQAVDHLETGTLVVVNGTETPAVPHANICRVRRGGRWRSVPSVSLEHGCNNYDCCSSLLFWCRNALV